MSQVERFAADESPNGNSLVRALSATTEVCALPDGWAGKFVTFYNNSTSIAYVNFGTAADMTLDETTDTVRGSSPFPLTLTAATPKCSCRRVACVRGFVCPRTRRTSRTSRRGRGSCTAFCRRVASRSDRWTP